MTQAVGQRKLRWPPERTGLKAPFLAAILSSRPRPPFVGLAGFAIAVGAGMAALMLAMDLVLFSGESFPRIRASASLPFWMRAALPVYAAIAEEVIYRFGVMTLVVWLAQLVAPPSPVRPNPAAAWAGIGVAALLFGLAHVANVPDASHPILRAVTLNGFAGVVLGWLYWKKGFEAAVLAHFGADSLIYLVIASVL